jgi:hypothetical protein
MDNLSGTRSSFDDPVTPMQRIGRSPITHGLTLIAAGLVAGLALGLVAIGIGMCGLFGEACSAQEKTGESLAMGGAVIVLVVCVVLGVALAPRRSWKVTLMTAISVWASAAVLGAVALSISGN